MPIQCRCPRGHAITVPSRRAGTKIRCPICSSVTEVPQLPPADDEVEAPPVAAPPAVKSAAPPPLPKDGPKPAAPSAKPSEPVAKKPMIPARQEPPAKPAEVAGPKPLAEEKKSPAARLPEKPSEPTPKLTEAKLDAPKADPPKVEAKALAAQSKSKPVEPKTSPAPVVEKPRAPERAETEPSPPAPPLAKSDPPTKEAAKGASAETPAPAIAARSASTEPPALPKSAPAAETPSEADEIVLPPPLPHELLEDLPGMTHHPEELWPVYTIAAALGALALFSLGPVVMEFISWFRAVAAMEETPGLGFWVWVVLMASLLELGYAIYLAQLPDWSSLWVVTLVAILIAAGYAGGLGLMMMASKDSSLIRDLGLAFLRESRSGMAALWCLCVMSLGGMLSYFSGSLSWQWSRRSLALLTAAAKESK